MYFLQYLTFLLCFLFCYKQIRAIKNLIIFSLPERKEFYPEVVPILISFSSPSNQKGAKKKKKSYEISFLDLQIVNMLEGSNDMTCTVLFSHFDQLRV